MHDEQEYTKSFDWKIWKRLAPFLPSEFLDKLALGLFNMDGRCGK